MAYNPSRKDSSEFSGIVYFYSTFFSLIVKFIPNNQGTQNLSFNGYLIERNTTIMKVSNGDAL
jgi:hypothetical protein